MATLDHARGECVQQGHQLRVFAHYIERACFVDEGVQGDAVRAGCRTGVADVELGEWREGFADQFGGVPAPFRVAGECGFQLACGSGRCLGVCAEGLYGVAGRRLRESPAVHLAERAVVERCRVEPAAEQGFGRGVHFGVDRARGTQGCEECRGSRCSGGLFSTAVMWGPAESVRGVAELARVEEVDGAELRA